MELKRLIKKLENVNLVKHCTKIGRGDYKDVMTAIIEDGTKHVMVFSQAGTVLFVVYKEDDWDALV